MIPQTIQEFYKDIPCSFVEKHATKSDTNCKFKWFLDTENPQERSKCTTSQQTLEREIVELEAEMATYEASIITNESEHVNALQHLHQSFLDQFLELETDLAQMKFKTRVNGIMGDINVCQSSIDKKKSDLVESVAHFQNLELDKTRAKKLYHGPGNLPFQKIYAVCCFFDIREDLGLTKKADLDSLYKDELEMVLNKLSILGWFLNPLYLTRPYFRKNGGDTRWVKKHRTKGRFKAARGNSDTAEILHERLVNYLFFDMYSGTDDRPRTIARLYEDHKIGLQESARIDEANARYPNQQNSLKCIEREYIERERIGEEEESRRHIDFEQEAPDDDASVDASVDDNVDASVARGEAEAPSTPLRTPKEADARFSKLIKMFAENKISAKQFDEAVVKLNKATPGRD